MTKAVVSLPPPPAWAGGAASELPGWDGGVRRGRASGCLRGRKPELDTAPGGFSHRRSCRRKGLGGGGQGGVSPKPILSILTVRHLADLAPRPLSAFSLDSAPFYAPTLAAPTLGRGSLQEGSSLQSLCLTGQQRWGPASPAPRCEEGMQFPLPPLGAARQLCVVVPPRRPLLTLLYLHPPTRPPAPQKGFPAFRKTETATSTEHC